MAKATLIGGILAYPINRCLVKNGLKLGMTTVHKETSASGHNMSMTNEHENHQKPEVTSGLF